MIPIRNIYYMLSYVFSTLQENCFSNIEAEKFSSVTDLLAEIMIIGINGLIKRGLDKQYTEITKPIPVIRSKLELNETIKTNSFVKNHVICTFDELTEDSYLNRILKTSMMKLISTDIEENRKKRLKKALMFFSNVKTLDIKTINWHQRFNRNNRVYILLVNISYLIIEGLIQSEKKGNLKIKNYHVDKKRMAYIFEKFILEYYRKHHKELNANPSHIKWSLNDCNDYILPTMISDITLQKGNRTHIIDAKYYGANMQERFEKKSIISNNLYQIFTYVKNKDAELKVLKNHEVSGMILYAKTDDDIQPNGAYNMSGNTIYVRTLDLNVPFEEIRAELEDIIRIFD